MESLESHGSSRSHIPTWTDWCALICCIVSFTSPWICTYYVFGVVNGIPETFEDNILAGAVSEGHLTMLGVFVNTVILSFQLVTAPQFGMSFVYGVIAEIILFLGFLVLWLKAPQVTIIPIIVTAVAIMFKFQIAVQIIIQNWRAHRQSLDSFSEDLNPERSRLISV